MRAIYYISTHTLTWSVTVAEGASSDTQKISTHTLTWSVTGGEIQLRDQDGNFNSHAHVERDV